MTKQTILIRIYLAFLAALACASLYIAFGLKTDVVVREGFKSGYEELHLDSELVEDAIAPQKVRKIYSWTASGIEGDYNELIFYTSHQGVEVYVDGIRVYRAEDYYRNPFGNTLGSLWHYVPLQEYENGDLIEIVLIPSYAAVIDNSVEMYFGTKYDIVRHIVLTNIIPVLLSILTIVAGVYYIVYSTSYLRETQDSQALLMLGFFSVELGAWKIFDSKLIDILWPGSLFVSLFPYICLLAMGVPAIAYCSSLMINREKKTPYIICYSMMGINVIVVILQLMNAVDFRQSLLVIQGVQVVSLVTTIVFVGIDNHGKGRKSKNVRSVIGMLICAGGLLTDVASYYLTDGTSMYFGMIGFLVFIILMGTSTMNETRSLISDGIKARKFEQLAYHDQLTGLYNRAAYSYDTTQEEFEPEHCIVVMFDLNDLKKCNDTMGHEKGDVYIRNSARLIQECFGSFGSVYRMGGDEFCCLLHRSSISDVKEMAVRLRKECANWNATSDDVKIRIAMGFQMFDRRIDYDIADTSRRADKMMYEDKFAMKTAEC